MIYRIHYYYQDKDAVAKYGSFLHDVPTDFIEIDPKSGTRFLKYLDKGDVTHAQFYDEIRKKTIGEMIAWSYLTPVDKTNALNQEC